MSTVLEALKGINAYPIPLLAILDAGIGRELDPTTEVDETILRSKEYKLATADLYYWLAVAPNVSQGGQSYSFTDEERKDFRNRATAIYDEYGEPDDNVGKGVRYGYKGSRL